MTKQEEIRKGIEKYTDSPAALWSYLHSQGVVIKVGEIKELPRAGAGSEAYVADGIGFSWERSAPIFGDFKRAGYVKTRSLIEEG